MNVSKLRKTNPAVGIVVGFLVLVWTMPTLGLFITSFRTPEQISATGWWQALFPSTSNSIHRTPVLTHDVQGQPLNLLPEGVTITSEDAAFNDLVQTGAFVVVGSVFDARSSGNVQGWGVSSRAPQQFAAGQVAEFTSGERIVMDQTGRYAIASDDPFQWRRGKRIFATAIVPPAFTFANYHRALFDPSQVDGMTRGLIGTASVAIPSTIIPIMIAAFAAYALAWMQIPARRVFLGLIIALLVVPLQLSLIPMLQFFNLIGLGKSYVSLLLAHTGFGLPLAIYLLYNYIADLPAELIQSARVEGANDFQIFTKLILPLSFPALASFAIFQFLWTWNDLLVARVFYIGSTGENTVMTSELVELLGSKGGDWEILATSAFISMIVPLIVFFALQRYLVRGLLAGSVK